MISEKDKKRLLLLARESINSFFSDDKITDKEAKKDFSQNRGGIS